MLILAYLAVGVIVLAGGAALTYLIIIGSEFNH